MSMGSAISNQQSAISNQQSAISNQNKRIKNRGFTLVETVFVIAIIGILLAIVLPVVSSMRDKTRKLQDVANLKRIADAYKTYVEKFGERRFYSMYSFIEHMAGRFNTDAILNDPYVYISTGDKWGSKPLKELLGGGSEPPWYCFNEYKTDLGKNPMSVVFSYAFIGGLNLNLPQDTTPLAFTRGLMSNGLWNETYGLYGNSGGYVIYLDGHVTWFDGSKPAKFLKYDNSGWTSDIREALPGEGEALYNEYGGSVNGLNCSVISCGDSLKSDFKDGENILLLYNSGTGGS